MTLGYMPKRLQSILHMSNKAKKPLFKSDMHTKSLYALFRYDKFLVFDANRHDPRSIP